MTEQEIIDRYSTPGLRKHELTRDVKRRQLIEDHRMKPEEADALCAKLYMPVEIPGVKMSREQAIQLLQELGHLPSTGV